MQDILDLPDVQTQGLSEKLAAFFESVPLPIPSSPDAPPPSSEIILEQDLVDELGSTADDAQVDSIVNKIAPTWWPTTKPAIDGVWDESVSNEIQLVSSGEPSVLVKLSDTLATLLMILWHYPTVTIANRAFGQILDRSNPCLRMQCKKFMDQEMSNILTLDTVPRRFDGRLHRRSKAEGEPYDNETEEMEGTQ